MSTITPRAAPITSSPPSKVSSRPSWPETLVGTIAAWVGDAVVEGRLRPGDDLNSVELARRFQTSRTPVREALLLLEKEGLVEIESRRRPRVKRWSRAEIADIYRLRGSLYAFVAELICTDATDEAIRELEPSCRELASAARKRDLDRFFWANVTFRETEARICGNALLQRMLDSLGLRVLPIRHYSMSLPGAMQESFSDRERILRAYYERDADVASSLNRAVVLRALARIERSGWKGME